MERLVAKTHKSVRGETVAQKVRLDDIKTGEKIRRCSVDLGLIFFFQPKTGYGIRLSFVGSGMCIRGRRGAMGNYISKSIQENMFKNWYTNELVSNKHWTLPTKREV